MAAASLKLPDLCARARAAGFTVRQGLATATMSRNGHTVNAAFCRDGLVHLSGKGSYTALLELFPSK